MASSTVHVGWLTKSPPEKKLHGPLKFFKAQWRRRYFVLSTGETPSPGGETLPSAYLHYYDSDNYQNSKKSRKKGCIDLSSCEEILAQIDSVFYEHVFSLRTLDRGRNRTYYLAADSVDDMNQWINCLCRVLRMDDSDSAMSSPDFVSPSSLGIQSLSSPLRKASLTPKTPEYPTPSPYSNPNSSALAHMSFPYDFPTNFAAEISESRLATRGSSSFYPPLAAHSCYPELRGSEDDLTDSPPPTLPVKSVRRRCQDADSRFGVRTSESALERKKECCDLLPEEHSDLLRERYCYSYFETEYDVLPAGCSRVLSQTSSAGDYDFPPPSRGGTTVSSKVSPAHDAIDYRESTSSYPDVFDPEVSPTRDQIPSSSELSSPIQVSSKTRSFRRSKSRSGPPVTFTVADEEQERSRSKNNTEDELTNDNLQEPDLSTQQTHPNLDIHTYVLRSSRNWEQSSSS